VIINAKHWKDLPADAWFWPHFSPAEMACTSSGELCVDAAFMDRLEALRAALGMPLPINSGYRTPAHNAAVSETGEHGPHTTGHAADIRINGAAAVRLIGLAPSLGFTGIGIAQKGALDARFVHLDDLSYPAFPRPTVWSY
jgi:hypothetical protein